MSAHLRTDSPAPPARGELRFSGVRASRPVECVSLPDAAEHVAAGGFWGVVGDFEGRVRAWRFAEVEWLPDDASPTAPSTSPWQGPRSWRSSTTESDYRAGVTAIRDRIHAGDVYQVNLCRELVADLSAAPASTTGPPAEPSAADLAARLAAGNPAPFGGYLHVRAGGGVEPVWIVTASPELFLRIEDGAITSGPIKGTATDEAGLSAKDRAENVMIADLVRNDLQRVCSPGTVEVLHLLGVEHHPGLVHLVTTVRGRLLAPGPIDWAGVLAATYPPASVSGAPKIAAVAVIDELEPGPRGPYCGAVGWIDSDRHRAELAVAIRTFWWDGALLRFGTGAGITWGSDPAAEWAETELKAARLIALASGEGETAAMTGGPHE